MSELEKKGLSFGYNEKFEEKHKKLGKLIDNLQNLQQTTKINILFETNASTTKRIKFESDFNMNIIYQEIIELKKSFVPIIQIYDTIPECNPGFLLKRSESGGHTEVDVFDSNVEDVHKKDLFITLFEKIKKEENIEELALKFSTIPFTEEQIALMFTKTF